MQIAEARELALSLPGNIGRAALRENIVWGGGGRESSRPSPPVTVSCMCSLTRKRPERALRKGQVRWA